MIMTRDREYYLMRIKFLTSKNPVANAKIINKLKRRARNAKA